MFLADYHCHSAFSPDGHDSIAAMLENAKRAGLTEIAVTDHCDMNLPFDTDAYRRAFLEAQAANKTGVRLLYAIEQGEGLHDMPRAEGILAREELDFVIGSYHAVKGGEDFYFMSYDSLEQCLSVLDAYMDELLEMARWAKFDVLGHLTYPLRYMTARAGFEIDFYGRYETAMRGLFSELVSRGLGIEINVSGLYRKSGYLKAMPELDVVSLYRACGGEIVTVGSDAHVASNVGCGIKRGMDIARAAGFSHVARFEKRKVFYEKI